MHGEGYGLAHLSTPQGMAIPSGLWERAMRPPRRSALTATMIEVHSAATYPSALQVPRSSGQRQAKRPSRSSRRCSAQRRRASTAESVTQLDL